MTEADRQPPTASPYQIFMLVCCVLVLVVLVVELALPLDPEILRILFYADTAFCVVFFADFLLSLARAKDRKRYLLTWGWIDLLSSLPAITELRAFRIGRVLRILRFLRAARAARVVGSFWMGRRAQTTALVAVSVAILTVVGASIAVLYLERAAGGGIGSGPAALWWSFFTVMTGQQGDPFPVTAAGRAIGLALMTVGAALVGTLTATLVSWVIRPREDAKDRQLNAIREEVAAIRALLEAR